ncbi:MAG: HD domain-containing protein [Candidatus Omnitrophica bacterium]|nr:HD domain-containing protein [Candidatus Omnitrophota bacterium]MDD5488003.1 HD domain-containing protein [Candidatus Omnitrophota bacterium]
MNPHTITDIKVLVVEDDPTSAKLLQSMLSKSVLGIAEIVVTTTLKESIEYISRNIDTDIVLLDLNLPDSTGLDSVSDLNDEHPDVAIVVITGAYAESLGLDAISNGAQDYLIKGKYDMGMLNKSILYAIERKKGENERKKSLEELQRVMEGTILAMATTVEMRDPYTAGHEQRVSQLATAIAGDLGLSEKQVNGIKMAAIIHDIGKIHIPAEILSKPGKISKIEFDLIKTHAQVGYDILKNIDFPWPIAQIVLQHHERIDGSGYPNGLKGDDILLESRIMAVADVVEAMASHRPYRPACGLDKALEEISNSRGILYDPNAVDACIRLFRERGFSF